MRKFRFDKTVNVDGTTWNIRERSLDDYLFTLQWSIDQKAKGNPENRSDCSSQRDASLWYGNTSLDQYEVYMREGWPEAIDGVTGLDGLCSDESERLQFIADVGGAFPNVPRFLSGHPQAMYNPVQCEVEHARGLTLVIDSGFHCGNGGDTILEYAREVMKLVAWLAAERIDVAIYSVIAMGYGGKQTVYHVRIRDLGQLLQPERIATIVHPCWLRRAFFAMAEYEGFVLDDPASHKEASSGYGYPQTPTLPLLKAMLPDAQSIILLPKPGEGDPRKAVEETLNLKLNRG